MSSPAFIPATKMDLDACWILAKTRDEEIRPYLVELVRWLADSNWPIAVPIINRLESVGTELVPVLLDVLKGSDHSWKYFLLSGLMLSCKPEVRELCMEEVVRIMNNPSASEREEEVDLVASDVMALYSSGNNG